MERKFTELEIKIMKNLYHNGVEYIARDIAGDIFSCDLRPKIVDGTNRYTLNTNSRRFCYISEYISGFNVIPSDDDSLVCIAEELDNYEVEQSKNAPDPRATKSYTKEELSVMKILYDNGAKYLARNYNGILRWYNLKPQKMDGKIKCWDAPGLSSNGSLDIFSNAFDLIKFEDAEPVCIRKELLAGGYSID